MAISERERHTLLPTFDDLTGSDVASILMSHLPPGGLGSLRSELHREIGSVRADMQAMTRTYILGNVGLVFTVAAIAFGTVRLV